MQTTPTNEKGLNSAPVDATRHPLTIRHRRLLLALLEGSITREEVDAIAGASNGPDEMLRLRRTHGMAIPCPRRPGRDMDNRPTEYGVYSLTERDRLRAVALLDYEKGAS